MPPARTGREVLDAHGRIRVGTILADRFEVINSLGEGGFATVYTARQVVIDRLVAIKVLDLPSTLAHREIYKHRFMQEAKLAASIDHPNIVHIYDFGIIEEIDKPFIAMELLAGRDLRQELYHGPLSATRAVTLISAALDALGAVHEAGIVHKDLKPSNVFITNPKTPRESCRLLDFGVALLDDPELTRLSRTGQLAGTVQYMAPEYIERQEVSPALDIYQMGLVLAEAVTGVPVVRENNKIEACRRHLKGELDIPESLRRSPLGLVILRALARDPERRYNDARGMREALLRLDESSLTHLATIEAPAFGGLSVSEVAEGPPPSDTYEDLEPKTIRIDKLKKPAAPVVDEYESGELPTDQYEPLSPDVPSDVTTDERDPPSSAIVLDLSSDDTDEDDLEETQAAQDSSHASPDKAMRGQHRRLSTGARYRLADKAKAEKSNDDIEAIEADEVMGPDTVPEDLRERMSEPIVARPVGESGPSAQQARSSPRPRPAARKSGGNAALPLILIAVTGGLVMLSVVLALVAGWFLLPGDEPIEGAPVSTTDGEGAVNEDGADGIVIISEPLGAQVSTGDEALGETPLLLTGTDGPTRLTFEKEGYERRTVTIDPAAPVPTIKLTPRR